MPTRKQRRRRDKSLRHEYETVLIDEEGNETLLDADEARATREERDKQRTESRAKAKPAAKSSRSSRPMREPPPPTWQRAFKRGGLMGALILVLFVFVLKGGSTGERIAIPLFYAVAFIPLTYVVDRWTYRTYQKRLAKKN
ncbi:MAG TPA: hypothetical protein VFW85_01850 [Gaiellaceae bacterium]|nr:hypothetical protein [Gaiellaceae bacterium]